MNIYQLEILLCLMESLIVNIINNKYKNVVILSGAGVSTNAGIPDYRSSSGIFRQLIARNEYQGVTNPKPFFSRDFVTKNHEFFDHPLVAKFRQQMKDAPYTTSHQLAKWFDDRGILRRVYTQNVDGLYQKAGLPVQKIVEYHGNYNDGTIVLYGDPIPAAAQDKVIEDFVVNQDTDLLIVMGSSLQVAPFCALPNMVSKHCTRVLVDINPTNAMINPWSKTKYGIDGLYVEPVMRSTIKIGKKRVSLRPQWHNKKKYLEQYIFSSDCDVWAYTIMYANSKTELL